MIVRCLPTGLPSFTINKTPSDFVDFLFVFSDIPTSDFYPTNLPNNNSRYSLSQWPLRPNGTNTLSVRATYTKDSGGPVPLTSPDSSVITHDDTISGPLTFLGGGSLSTDTNLLQVKGSYSYTEIPPSFYTGTTPPIDSFGYDNDLYLNTTTLILYKRTSAVWVSQGPFLQSGFIYAGVGSPNNSVGYNGSFYFDLTSSTIYGPKATGSWTSVPTYNLNRPAFLTGIGVTSLISSYGIVGDMYLDISAGKLYGPKTNSGWDLTVFYNLTGGKIVTGVVDPVLGDGDIGDFFLNTVTKILFGPKLSTGWDTSGIMLGNSSAGSNLIVGITPPVMSIGSIGSVYIDKTNFKIYGPKNATEWPLLGGITPVEPEKHYGLSDFINDFVMYFFNNPISILFIIVIILLLQFLKR